MPKAPVLVINVAVGGVGKCVAHVVNAVEIALMMKTIRKINESLLNYSVLFNAIAVLNAFELAAQKKPMVCASLLIRSCIDVP